MQYSTYNQKFLDEVYIKSLNLKTLSKLQLDFLQHLSAEAASSSKNLLNLIVYREDRTPIESNYDPLGKYTNLNVAQKYLKTSYVGNFKILKNIILCPLPYTAKYNNYYVFKVFDIYEKSVGIISFLTENYKKTWWLLYDK